jgi:hypothetical protein
MAEAAQTSNPVKLLLLALDIRKALEIAHRASPDDVPVLVDLVRFHTVTPKIAGGDPAEARRHAKNLARIDPGLGHFATGYIAYREKQFGVARRELREAVRLTRGEYRDLALRWLGWLSQESQQWADAFAAWEQLRATDPHALYEIARTAVFCHCEQARGKAALEEYRKLRPKDEEAARLATKLEPAQPE